MKALVTGGGGFIGHHVVGRLLADGHDVRVLDDFSTGARERLAAVIDRIELIEGSILEDGPLHRAVDGCEVVFHQAALPSVARSLLDPMTTHEVNVTGTMNVMLAAAEAGVRRVVVAGSSSVYGVPAELPCCESTAPRPVSPYGVSKLATEAYAHALGERGGVETVVLRYFNVFGPGQDPASEYSAVVPLFVTAALEGRSPTVNGDGRASRDFTYVDNVVHANMLAAQPDTPTGLTCNVACGSRTTLLELLDAIGVAVGRTVGAVHGPPRAGDIRHSLADIDRAQRELGYQVVVPFGQGIARTVDWYRSHTGSLSGLEY